MINEVEMIEKLMEKADVTMEEARGVLESLNWNLLDALIALEKEGKIKSPEPASWSTKQDISDDIETIKNTSEPETFRDVLKKAFSWLKNTAATGMNNRFCVNRKDGSEMMSIPVTILVILLILALFSGAIVAVAITLIIMFFCGVTFSFDGPDLGTEKINSAMSKIKYTPRKDTTEDTLNDRK